jgi:hypothetical protein
MLPAKLSKEFTFRVYAVVPYILMKLLSQMRTTNRGYDGKQQDVAIQSRNFV